MITRALFICTANLQRSPTAEIIYSGCPGLEVRSAGIDRSARIPLTEDLLHWAEIVFVMEDLHRLYVERAFPAVARTKQIVCLDVPDLFYYMDQELVSLLAEKLHPYLGEPGIKA